MLDKYKKLIDLVKFLKQDIYGFEDAKNSTTIQPILERTKDEKKETFTIQRNKKNEFIYWKDKSLNPETIVDFVIENHNKEFSNEMKLTDVDNHLKSFVRNKEFLIDGDCEIAYAQSSYTSIAKDLNYIEDLKDRTILYEKGISDETIDSPMFKKIIYNVPGDDPLGVGYLSINDTKVCAININAEKGASTIGEVEQGITVSELVKDPPVDIIVVAESMEEAMAHYQLDYDDIQYNNVRYIATGKNPSLEQLRLIQTNIDKLNPKTLVIATSNTIDGEFTQNKILSKLNISEEGKMLNKNTMNFRGYIDCEMTDKNGLINITLPKDIPNYQENLEKLINGIETKQQTFNNLHSEGEPFSVEIDSEGKKDTIVHLKFNNNKVNWKISAELINEVKFDNQPFIKRDVSMQENFNEDLKFQNENPNSKDNDNYNNNEQSGDMTMW